MEYYIFCRHRLARRRAPFQSEWLLQGEWKEDRAMSLALEDALHDYGDYSAGDQDRIPEEMARVLAQNGSIVLQGDIGFGTTCYEPLTIQLSDWKKPATDII